MPRSTSTTYTNIDDTSTPPAQAPTEPPAGPVANPQPTPFVIPSVSPVSNIFSNGLNRNKFLINSFGKTNLDTEHSSPNGGIPYSQANDPTSYPTTTMRTTPTRGYFASSGVAASKFYQTWSSKNTYLDSMQKYI